ncbi:MAG TPA: MFS transporter [Fibrobacteria bacterium]|nr:MFS transporter [Fibrobacteria bacterium]
MHDDSTALRASKALPSGIPPDFGAEPQPIPPEPGETKLGGLYVGPPVIRGALLNSFRDGIMANGMIALTDTFGIAAAVALRASSMGIALLSSLPQLIGSIGQFLFPAWADPGKGRKHYVLRGVRGQALFLFLAGFAGWLPGAWAPWAYIALFASASISNTLTGPFWVAWMGDLMPGSARGRHFAWRSVFFSWMYLSCSLTAGIVSRRYDAHNAPWLLFACIFATAAALRGVSYLFLTRQYEPASSAHEAFSPLSFRPGRDFLIYCLATGLFQGAASMSGPFFSVWYLRDLHFSYLFLSLCLSLTVFGSIAFAGFWGHLADRLGTSRVLWISGLLAATIPFIYLFTGSPWVIWAGCFYSGATWGGYNLANFNHMLNATDSRHRSHYIAFSSLVLGLIGCAFSLAGGFLATRLPVLFGWRLQSLFLLSGILRVGIFLAFFGRFREYRKSLPKSSPEDIYMELPGFRMGAGLVRTVFRGFRGA